jgi:cobalamin biosynthesis protein CobD/CbiB
VRRETAPCPESEQGGRQDGWHLALLAAALIVGLGGRLLYSLNTTLWFDETFTGCHRQPAQPARADRLVPA